VMRVTVVALALLIGAGAARADSSPLEAYAPLKVVGLMPDTSQALVWDEPVAEYRLVKVGDTLEGWKVLEISARAKRVTVAPDDVRAALALTRLPRPNAMITYATKVVTVPAKPPAAAAADPAAPLPTPVPPTATVAPGPNAPVATDMLASPGVPNQAESNDPIDPYAPGAPAPAPVAAPAVPAPRAAAAVPAPPAVPAPVGPDPAEASAPLDPYAAQAAPAVVPGQPTVIADNPEAPVAVERHAIRRIDLDREINDFDRLMATV